jgi:1-acyl-sn-glycerol-3-phosphate acyltransferase
VRGVIASLILGGFTALIALPLFAIALLKLLIPLRPWRRLCSTALNGIAAAWIEVNRLWMPRLDGVDWHVAEGAAVDRRNGYLVTCNHQSWADIFIAQTVLNRRLPQLKFFLKQELIWVPVIGLCWWALDFPFMKRYDRAYLKKHPEKIGKDLETARAACEKFRDLPVSLFIFLEGTRFSTAKHTKQKSPYTHLLKPKTAAAGLVFGNLGQQVKTLVDLTIGYHGQVPSFWDLLCGRARQVSVVVAVRPVPATLLGRDYTADSAFRTELNRWGNELWEEKDRRLENIF